MATEDNSRCVLDATFSSNLLISKIADIPQKLKYETIMKTLLGYCFGRTDDGARHKFSNGEYYYFTVKPFEDCETISETILAESNPDLIDWIRDRTFIYDQLLEFHSDRFKVLLSKLLLWKNRDFLLNYALHVEGILADVNDWYDYLKERQVVLTGVNEYGLYLDYVSEDLKNDFQVVKTAVYQNGLALQHASDELRNNKEIVMIAIRNDYSSLEYASDELRNDIDFVKMTLEQSALCLKYASDELRNNKEVALIALESEPEVFDFLYPKLQYDRDIIIKTCSKSPDYLKKASKKLNTDLDFLLMMAALDGIATLNYATYVMRSDKEIVMEAVQQNPLALEYATDNLKNDRELVRMAVMKDGTSLKYASSYLQDDKEIVELALQSSPDAIWYISNRWRFDNTFIFNLIGKRGFNNIPPEFTSFKDIVLESIKLNHGNYIKSPDKEDREFTLQAVKINGLVFEHVNEEFAKDPEIIVESIRQNRRAFKNMDYRRVLNCVSNDFFNDAESILKYECIPIEHCFQNISKRLIEDRSFILQLVRRCGLFFAHLSRKYRIDREIVMEALKTAPDIVLENTSYRIRNDRVFAMRIVKRNGMLLGRLCSKHRNDKEIVSFAIQQNKKAFKYASEDLQNDKEGSEYCIGD